jgi:hypothetical protein
MAQTLHKIKTYLYDNTLGNNLNNFMERGCSELLPKGKDVLQTVKYFPLTGEISSFKRSKRLCSNGQSIFVRVVKASLFERSKHLCSSDRH